MVGVPQWAAGFGECPWAGWEMGSGRAIKVHRPTSAWPRSSPGRLVARGAVRPGRAVRAEEEARGPEMLSSEKRSMLSLLGARGHTLLREAPGLPRLPAF